MGRVLTVKQVAERLQVRPNTVRAWLKCGRIPGRRIGRIYRILEDELDMFIVSEATRLPARGTTERKSARGMFAHIPGSVEDFMREKHAETEREERRRP